MITFLVEPGPPLFEISSGIALIYNSAGRYKDGLKYKVGVAIFDKKSPDRVIARTENPIMVPEYEWELYGHVNNVVFVDRAREQTPPVLWWGRQIYRSGILDNRLIKQ